MVLLIVMINTDKTNKPPQKELESNFVSPIDSVNTQSIWIERAQNQLKEQQRQTEELKQSVSQLKDDKSNSEQDNQYLALKEQVELLQKALEEKNNPENAPLSGSSQYKGNVFSTTPGADLAKPPAEAAIDPQLVGIDHDELELKPNGFSRPNKNPQTFVPAGTFAEAIMLGAADASAGVSSQSNPSPMLFRLIANGTLPNHQKSHLKDCVVTAAVVGDISSERGLIRLERMSCTFPNGEIVEQPVEGTIFGMDAKNGVRGNPVWRESALLGRAAVAGTLSGIGNGISQGYTTNSISPLGSTQTVPGADIFKYGAAQGASSAMAKRAEYNIRRAEQYHPVIQVTAGQPVDVVFLKGFYLDGRKHEEVEQETTQQSELFPSSNASQAAVSNSLTLSDKDMAKLQRHEESMGWVKREANLAGEG